MWRHAMKVAKITAKWWFIGLVMTLAGYKLISNKHVTLLGTAFELIGTLLLVAGSLVLCLAMIITLMVSVETTSTTKERADSSN